MRIKRCKRTCGHIQLWETPFREFHFFEHFWIWKTAADASRSRPLHKPRADGHCECRCASTRGHADVCRAFQAMARPLLSLGYPTWLKRIDRATFVGEGGGAPLGHGPGSWREEEAGRGRGALKNGRKSEVLRMRFPIVENVRTSSDILLDTSRGLQLPYRKKSKKSSFFDRFFKFSYFSVFFCLGSLAAVISHRCLAGMCAGSASTTLHVLPWGPFGNFLAYLPGIFMHVSPS